MAKEQVPPHPPYVEYLIYISSPHENEALLEKLSKNGHDTINPLIRALVERRRSIQGKLLRTFMPLEMPRSEFDEDARILLEPSVVAASKLLKLTLEKAWEATDDPRDINNLFKQKLVDVFRHGEEQIWASTFITAETLALGGKNKRHVNSSLRFGLKLAYQYAIFTRLKSSMNNNPRYEALGNLIEFALMDDGDKIARDNISTKAQNANKFIEWYEDEIVTEVYGHFARI